MMKRLLFLLAIVLLASCSKDDSEEIPKRDIIVFNSTTFISEEYEKEIPRSFGFGIVDTVIEVRRDVIRFNDEERVINFTVDEYDDITPGSDAVDGYYKLDYPKVYNIIAHIFDEEEIIIEKDNDGIYFFADNRRFEPTYNSFD